ncbi:hypothetical protein K3495_g17352, partial [Podosphaera aphanis]
LHNMAELDDFAARLGDMIQSAVKTAGKRDCRKGHSAPWWTSACQEAYDEHRIFRNRGRSDGVADETRTFYTVVRKAKKEYWQQIIDGVSSDKDLYRIINWHKLGPNLKSPPLVVRGRTIEDMEEKAEALREEILGRFDASDDLEEDPLENWEGSGHLPWDTTIS